MSQSEFRTLLKRWIRQTPLVEKQTGTKVCFGLKLILYHKQHEPIGIQNAAEALDQTDAPGRKTNGNKVYDKYILADTLDEDLAKKYLETLELRYCRLKHDVWNDIASRDVQIDELKLDYTDLRKKVSGLPAFIINAHVQKLSLINTKLRTRDLEIFYKELNDQKDKDISLHSLNLMFVEIDADGCKFLAQILNLLPVVKELIIKNCDLRDDGVENFYETISDGKVIQKLSLGENDRITPEGMFFVGKIAERYTVENLQLTSCDLRDKKLKQMSEAVPKNIEVLDLSQNMGLSPSAIKELGMKWNTLKELDVRGCWFKSDDVEMLKEDLECKVYADEDGLPIQSESEEADETSSSTSGSSEECHKNTETTRCDTSSLTPYPKNLRRSDAGIELARVGISKVFLNPPRSQVPKVVFYTRFQGNVPNLFFFLFQGLVWIPVHYYLFRN